MDLTRFRILLATTLSVLCLVGTVWFPASGKAAETGATPSLQNVSLVLDWYPNSDHAGIYTAAREGIFRRNHLAVNVHVPADTSAQIPLVAAGHADFGISYETDLLAARARHLPVQSVMCIMQHPLNTVMSLQSSHITRPRQLAGKTIGMAGSPSDRPIVSAMLQHDGVSIRQVRMVNVGYNLLPVLLAHKVDAVVGVYWTWEAIQAREKGSPVNVMRVEQWGVPNYCELVLVTNEATIRTRPQVVKEMVQSLQTGYAAAEARPESAWAALHQADKTLHRSLILQSLDLLRPAVTGATTIGNQNATQWVRYAAWLSKNKLISRSVAVDRAFTNRFLLPGIR